MDSKFQFRATLGSLAGLSRYAIRAEQRVASEFVSTHCKGENLDSTPVDRLRFQGFVACLPAFIPLKARIYARATGSKRAARIRGSPWINFRSRVNANSFVTSGLLGRLQGSRRSSGGHGLARVQFFLREKPFHRAAGRIGLSGLRLARLLGRLGFDLQSHELLPPLVRGRALEPVEELRGRIDLVIVLALREDGQLVQVCVEPRRRLGDVDKTVLDQRSNSVRSGVRLAIANPDNRKFLFKTQTVIC